MARTNILICTPGRLLQHMDRTADFDASTLQILGNFHLYAHGAGRSQPSGGINCNEWSRVDRVDLFK